MSVERVKQLMFTFFVATLLSLIVQIPFVVKSQNAHPPAFLTYISLISLCGLATTGLFVKK